MINLKLFGLPRTGTNAVAWNVEQTWPGLVKVWHEKTPGADVAWQHGPPRVCGDIDGYLLTTKPLEAWLVSMRNYNSSGGKTRRDLVRVWGTENSVGIWRRFQSAAAEFLHQQENALFVAATQSREDMKNSLQLIEKRFCLPAPDAYHVELYYMRRGADDGGRLSDDLYQWP